MTDFIFRHTNLEARANSRSRSRANDGFHFPAYKPRSQSQIQIQIQIQNRRISFCGIQTYFLNAQIKIPKCKHCLGNNEWNGNGELLLIYVDALWCIDVMLVVVEAINFCYMSPGPTRPLRLLRGGCSAVGRTMVAEPIRCSKPTDYTTTDHANLKAMCPAVWALVCRNHKQCDLQRYYQPPDMCNGTRPPHNIHLLCCERIME